MFPLPTGVHVLDMEQPRCCFQDRWYPLAKLEFYSAGTEIHSTNVFDLHAYGRLLDKGYISRMLDYLHIECSARPRHSLHGANAVSHVTTRVAAMRKEESDWPWRSGLGK